MLNRMSASIPVIAGEMISLFNFLGWKRILMLYDAGSDDGIEMAERLSTDGARFGMSVENIYQALPDPWTEPDLGEYSFIADEVIETEVRLIVTMSTSRTFFWLLLEDLYNRGLRGDDIIIYDYITPSAINQIPDEALRHKVVNLYDNSIQGGMASFVGEHG
jgi:hypothetical protein